MLAAMKGVYIVAQTPFDADAGIDLASVDTLVDFYCRHGADGFTVLGVSGEAGKLTEAESLAVAKRYIARAGGRPVKMQMTVQSASTRMALLLVP